MRGSGVSPVVELVGVDEGCRCGLQGSWGGPPAVGVTTAAEDLLVWKPWAAAQNGTTCC